MGIASVDVGVLKAPMSRSQVLAVMVLPLPGESAQVVVVFAASPHPVGELAVAAVWGASGWWRVGRLMAGGMLICGVHFEGR